MLLDAGSVIYVWVGGGASPNERRRAPELAEQYADAVARRGGRPREIPIVQVAAGHEPVHFKAHFHGWSDEKADPFYDPYEAKLRAIKDVRRARASTVHGASAAVQPRCESDDTLTADSSEQPASR